MQPGRAERAGIIKIRLVDSGRKMEEFMENINTGSQKLNKRLENLPESYNTRNNLINQIFEYFPSETHSTSKLTEFRYSLEEASMKNLHRALDLAKLVYETPPSPGEFVAFCKDSRIVAQHPRALSSGTAKEFPVFVIRDGLYVTIRDVDSKLCIVLTRGADSETHIERSTIDLYPILRHSRTVPYGLTALHIVVISSLIECCSRYDKFDLAMRSGLAQTMVHGLYNKVPGMSYKSHCHSDIRMGRDHTFLLRGSKGEDLISLVGMIGPQEFLRLVHGAEDSPEDLRASIDNYPDPNMVYKYDPIVWQCTHPYLHGDLAFSLMIISGYMNSYTFSKGGVYLNGSRVPSYVGGDYAESLHEVYTLTQKMFK